MRFVLPLALPVLGVTMMAGGAALPDPGRAVAPGGISAQTVVAPSRAPTAQVVDPMSALVAAGEKVAAEAAALAQQAAEVQAAQARAAEARAAEARAAEARAAEDRAAEARAAEDRQRQERASRSRNADPKSIASSMLSARGQGGQFDCLDRLWTRESEWQVDAENASSGAYGIPQSLPAGKMASAGADWRTNAATQIRWGLDYIDGRHGSPCGAWRHSQANGWY
ncbi:MAG: hypothetical protein M3486_09305 [Actinomycetota bacterium]|nr:hypothetical protein [Actinomycetota bacterium]